MRKIAFPPIVDSNSRILLLGTMPSEESLRKQEYYGHKSNQFWKILFTLFAQPFSIDYKERVALLIENRIALWDVLCSCEGQGSADTNIKNGQPNNFALFLSAHPHITHIFFTSKKAEEFYRKYIGFDNNKVYLTLPSPSPANAGTPLVQKIEKWKVIFSVLKS
ncbi:DNA-deoxyinosine glycosylase [Dysgonomonas sp. ZJ709]|uniref:DNA-deoxyinosine glycosylase n=1 Tax=Dysgonomonas sp. ZJ709 TaxID=2709797 RepID=UPI0013E9AA7A|nr:DNA-deoxyinosine glycosylase [Dysgonomonas sp. ZJ709]